MRYIAYALALISALAMAICGVHLGVAACDVATPQSVIVASAMGTFIGFVLSLMFVYAGEQLR